MQKKIAFLTRNHRLTVEVGRWRSIPSNERKCPHCTDDIGDESLYDFYLATCPPKLVRFLHEYSPNNARTEIRKRTSFGGHVAK